MAQPAPITILLPVRRNGAADFGQAIESVLGQTHGDFRLIVSDNGSTDDTVARVSGYLSDPRVVLVRQTGDLDMIAHFNRCLEMLESPYHSWSVAPQKWAFFQYIDKLRSEPGRTA